MAKDEGRMKKQVNRTRSCQMKFYATEIERERIKTEAKAAEMGLDEYLRECALKNTSVRLNPKDFTEISKSLISIQQSIDKISKEEKMDEEDRRYEELREVVEDMQGVIFKAVGDIYDKYL